VVAGVRKGPTGVGESKGGAISGRELAAVARRQVRSRVQLVEDEEWSELRHDRVWPFTALLLRISSVVFLKYHQKRF
jgi:hypothetical protein